MPPMGAHARQDRHDSSIKGTGKTRRTKGGAGCEEGAVPARDPEDEEKDGVEPSTAPRDSQKGT